MAGRPSPVADVGRPDVPSGVPRGVVASVAAAVEGAGASLIDGLPPEQSATWVGSNVSSKGPGAWAAAATAAAGGGKHTTDVSSEGGGGGGGGSFAAQAACSPGTVASGFDTNDSSSGGEIVIYLDPTELCLS